MARKGGDGSGGSTLAMILFILSISILQNAVVVLGLVTDYEIITWNTNGYRMPEVLRYMENHQNIHSIFIQESGNTIQNIPLGGYLLHTLPNHRIPRLIIASGEAEYACDFNDFLHIRFTFLTTGQPLFIYYSSAFPGGNVRIGQTIVSRQLVPEVILFANEHVRCGILDNRAFINRPIMGLIIPNNHGTHDILLNIHAEPSQMSNEATVQLSIISHHMNTCRRHDSWLLIGDFNRDPSTIQSYIDVAQEHIVVPNGPTRLQTILDYVIYGSQNRQSFQQMFGSNYHGNVMDDQRAWLHGSDHRPVHFTNYITSIIYDERNLQNLLKQNYCKGSINDEKCDNFENWSDFYNNLDMHNEPLSTMKAKSFADGSRIQPIVVEGSLNITESSSWIPRNVVYAFFKNLDFVTLGRQVLGVVARGKRSLTETEVEVVYYGIIIINKYRHPVMTVFHEKDELICSKWLADSGWSAASTCDKNLTLSQFEMNVAGYGSDVCLSGGRINDDASDNGDDVFKEYRRRITDLYKRNTKNLNLDVLIRNFERTVDNDGFYFENYASWQDFYNDRGLDYIRTKGIDLAGQSKYFFFGNRCWNFGYYFKDGSFAIGFHSENLRATDRDNWLFINDNTLQTWTEKTYAGMFFFDKMGRPATLVIGQSHCFFPRCFWIYEYDEGDYWKWISHTDTTDSLLSRNTKALEFYVNKKDVHNY